MSEWSVVSVTISIVHLQFKHNVCDTVIVTPRPELLSENTITN